MGVEKKGKSINKAEAMAPAKKANAIRQLKPDLR